MSSARLRTLAILDSAQPHTFVEPAKKIHEGHDVQHFLTSKAYRDIGIFVMQLNIAMCPKIDVAVGKSLTWQLDSPVTHSEPISKLQKLLETIDAIIDEAPPDTGPRRFGNISFRKWFEILESRIQGLLTTYLPEAILSFNANSSGGISAVEELTPYFLGGFGSPQRLDYGTGHELSFLAFLGCIWKLGGFSKGYSPDGSLERSLVIGVIEPYLRVIRRLILTYTLEPAGSHGVWGLDDHSFLPYIFGSSQYCPAITDEDPMPVEGSLPGSPNPGDIAKKNLVDRERRHNMYFSAVGFINDVKTGPFWEHSPILFDISGVKAGWGKINKGMVKMYNAEVLSKFPVVQHFPFGYLFSWDHDPEAAPITNSAHMANQPSQQLHGTSMTRPGQDGTKPSQPNSTGTAAPWAQPTTRAVATTVPGTRAPWATSHAQLTTQAPSRPAAPMMPPMRAPWADAKPYATQPDSDASQNQ